MKKIKWEACISNQLMIFGSDRKKSRNSAVWQKKIMSERIRGYVIANKGLSYFQCLRSKFEIYAARFVTK